MRTTKLTLLATFVFCFTFLADANVRAKVNRSWLEFDVIEDGKEGIKLHTDFNLSNCRGEEAYIYVFIKDANGIFIKGSSSEYCNADGTLYFEKQVIPQYNNTRFDDISVFIPLEAMELEPNQTYYIVDYICYNGDYIANGEGVAISSADSNANQQQASDSNATEPIVKNPTAFIKNSWIELDVNEQGKNGFKVHANLNIKHCKGLDTYVNIFIKDANDNWLKGTTNKYCNADGTLCISQKVVPNYESSQYNDFSVFIPYEAYDFRAVDSYYCRVYVNHKGKYLTNSPKLHLTGVGYQPQSQAISQESNKTPDNEQENVEKIPTSVKPTSTNAKPTTVQQTSSGASVNVVNKTAKPVSPIKTTEAPAATTVTEKPVEKPAVNAADLATIDWQNPVNETKNGSYELKAEIKSKSKLQSVKLYINSQKFNVKLNDLYFIFLNNILKLKDGVNAIKIEATNESGTAILQKTVYSYQSATPLK